MFPPADITEAEFQETARLYAMLAEAGATVEQIDAYLIIYHKEPS